MISRHSIAGGTECSLSSALIDSGKRFDLLFTDIGLPAGMNGFELAERSRQRQPGLRVLYATGYGTLREQNGAAPHQPEHLLRKPYRTEELAAALRTALA